MVQQDISSSGNILLDNLPCTLAKLLQGFPESSEVIVPQMERRLTLIIFIIGVVELSIVEVDAEKWIQINGNKRSSVFRPNDIVSNEVYQYVNTRKQSRNTWNNFNKPLMTTEILEPEENELLKMLLDSSEQIDFEKLDSIGDQVISHANVSEETKRVARQVKKTRPGFFWTIFRVAFETINETKSAIQQINGIIESNIAADTTTIKASLKEKPTTIKSITVNTLSSSSTITSTTPRTPTTKAPYKLTRNALQSLVRRNLQGLIRLFNIEWKDAITQSQISVREFQNNLGKSAQPFLADNPAAY
ncbi:hypothetical protein PV327_005397 [Microctonus hyperodae]|uniref:Uncharacterized protein n=1 Tax=Microctonus hyperodae TaxID=165561 RepID=A0AA39KZP3_MICHY|nr:hypothetical protein PV327_005397 [Microctonus hyperodae]